MSDVFDMLEKHPAAQALKRRGLTSDQLHSIRFYKFNSEIPVDEQAITWTAFPQAYDAGCPSLLRQIAIYRYALENGRNADDAKNVARAFDIAAFDLASPFIAIGMAHQAAQKAKAKKPRGVLRGLDKTISEFVIEFVRRPDSRDMTAKELWDEFYSHLESSDLYPRDCGQSYEYQFNCKRRFIAWRTFENHVRRVRKEMAH